MIVDREVRHHPTVRGRIGLRPETYAGLPQGCLQPLGHRRRVAAVVLGRTDVDLRLQLRREQVGARWQVGGEIAAVKACGRRDPTCLSDWAI